MLLMKVYSLPIDYKGCIFRTKLCVQVSQKAGKVVWYSHLFRNLPQFVVIHTVKGFSIVNKAEVDIFYGIPLLSLKFNECWQFDLQFLCLF